MTIDAHDPSPLRRVFGSSTRTWLSGWAVAAALVAATALLESIFMSGDTWQYLATFLLGYFLFLAWTLAGALVGIAALLRSKVPVIETIVHGLLGAAIVIAVAVWAFYAAYGIASASTY